MDMKKIISWLTIFFCSLFLLIFLLGLLVIIHGIWSDPSRLTISTKEIISSVIGFFVVFTLLILGLKNGIKGAKKEKAVKRIDYTDELNINFKGQIAYKDYRNLILGITFKRPLYVLIAGIMVLSLLSILIYGMDSWNSVSLNLFPWVPIGLVIYVPIHTIAGIKKLYHADQLLQEQLTYRLDNYGIHMKGETVDLTQKWIHFYKIKETKYFFLLYHGEMVATLLDKKMFALNDVIIFQRFIKSLDAARE